jgi:NAD(P)-dependent dehydrogenase (short-subunit alcohol dehydrogenase family)
MALQLKDKVAFITGGARDVGAAIALAVAEEDAESRQHNGEK